jgi:hypothetical protein
VRKVSVVVVSFGDYHVKGEDGVKDIALHE